MGNSSSKRRATGKTKDIRGFKLGGQEENRLSERVTLKVWRMLTPEARTIIREGGEGKIAVVKEGGVNENRHGVGKLSSQNKKLRAKLILLTMTNGKQDPSATKDLDELI